VARLPKRITYGIVAINDWQIPRRYQIPIISAHLETRCIPARVSRRRSAAVSVGIEVEVDRKETMQAAVILAGRIYNFIACFCGVKHCIDLKMGKIG